MIENAVSVKEIQDFCLWKKIEAKRHPLFFDFEITSRCNMNCRHCYICLPAGDRAAKKRELSLREIDEIAGEAVSMGAMWCLITGGEPLLREDFFDIYLSLKRKGLLLSVYTNATLINEEHVELFRTYPPRDLEVTVYGVTKETYEKVTRKRGSFSAFMRGIELLLNGGVKARFKAMAIRSNVHELIDIASFSRERTIDYFRFDPILHLRIDGNEKRNEEIISERLTSEEIVAIERADPERFQSLQNGCDQLINSDFTHNGSNHIFHCGAGDYSFSINCIGIFRLCLSLCQKDCVYDLRKGNLTDAWKNFAPKVRELKSYKDDFHKMCRVCPIINLCMWCPAHAHLETGALDEPVPYFCEVAHARAEALQTRESSSNSSC